MKAMMSMVGDLAGGLTDYLWAFVIGGAICLLGQILMDATKMTAPRVLVLFVVSGVVLQALVFYMVSMIY